MKISLTNTTSVPFQTWICRLTGLFLLVSLSFSCSDSVDHGDSKQPVDYFFPGESWERITNLEEAGWLEERLNAAEAYSDNLDNAAVVIVHKGRVVRSWGETDRKFELHSVRKSLLSALYGIQVEQGAIDMSATLEDLGIDDNHPLTIQERQATVEMLLKARSGVYHPALYETASMAANRPKRHAHEPGTFFYYNNWDFNTLGTIYEQETGENIHQSFEERIARPIGMQDYTAEDGRYVTGDASQHAAYPLVMTAYDLARFGLLFLNRGEWDGERVLPEGWVEESTQVHSVIIGNRSDRGGYGYMWWVEVDGTHYPNTTMPPRTYTARGTGGQVLAVIPEHDLVVVQRVNTFENKSVSSSQTGQLLRRILDAHI